MKIASRWRAVVMLGVSLSALSLIAGACSSTPSREGKPARPRRVLTQPAVAWGVSVTGAPACDPLGGAPCMSPFPSDYYAQPDPRMPSGWRVDIPQDAMPASSSGQHIDPSAWEENDGFSPGSPILALAPDLSSSRSHLPGVGAVDACLAASSPIVLLDANTMRRLPCWAELDVRNSDPATRLLIVHPAANLPEGSDIIVALRDLVTSSGKSMPAQATFARILSGTDLRGVAGRALGSHIGRVISELSSAGVSRKGMYLAWDFTVASRQNITGWAVQMRDEAFRELGSKVPPYRVTSVTNFTTSASSHESAQIARQVTGTFDVPSFLDEPGGPQGATLNFGKRGLPTQIPGNVQQAVFSCLIPRSTGLGGKSTEPVHPARPMLYGKGLFSVATDMDAPGVIDMADRYGFVLCSTNWMGLDGNDIANDASAVMNLSLFPTIPDRLLQSMVDALFLGRLMADPQGFAASPSFELRAHPLIDTSEPLVYYGNSEGSLMGGAVTAISPEWRRAVLGVPSMNYAVLLPRSVDFSEFQALLDKSYPNISQQLVIFDLLGMLWDRAETDGYAEDLVRDPLPGTPVHQVLLQMAYGDHQVANVTTFTEARTLGAAVHRPALPASLARAAGHPFEGLASLPDHGSYRGRAALYEWYDTFVKEPPTGDVPPAAGPDPHDTIPRSLPSAQRQLVEFLETGNVPDVCGNSPCVTNKAISG